jgi:hypothetical protein
MPTSLPQVAIKFRFDEIKNREPSYVTVFLSVALTLIVPPLLLIIAAAATVGHGELSFTSISAVLEAAGRAELCMGARDCGEPGAK